MVELSASVISRDRLRNHSTHSIIGSPTAQLLTPPSPQRARELYAGSEGRAVQIFQLLIHSMSLEPAGFIATFVDTTSMGLMVTKS